MIDKYTRNYNIIWKYSVSKYMERKKIQIKIKRKEKCSSWVQRVYILLFLKNYVIILRKMWNKKITNYQNIVNYII